MIAADMKISYPTSGVNKTRFDLIYWTLSTDIQITNIVHKDYR